jgi:RNA polymerase sigma-70 factor, ECF subfamily
MREKGNLQQVVERPMEEPCLMTPAEGKAIDEVLGDCMPRLFRAANYVLRNHHDSEDALQDGLLSAIRHFDQFKGNSQLSTWLYSIVRNSALANLRRQRNHPMLSMDDQDPEFGPETFLPEIPADSSSDPEKTYAQAELSSMIAETLESMPPNYSTIIQMCDVEGFSGKEAARELGLTVSALKAQHHRARQALRVSMGGHAARKRDLR